MCVHEENRFERGYTYLLHLSTSPMGLPGHRLWGSGAASGAQSGGAADCGAALATTDWGYGEEEMNSSGFNNININAVQSANITLCNRVN